MAEALLVRQAPLPGQWQWLDLAAPAGGVCGGGLAELAAAAGERAAILVWPASAALLLEIDLPLRSAGQIAKALPFALEDLLAEDAERYQLSWHRPARGQAIAVAAVGRELLAAVIDNFAEAGVRLSMALPEALLLPWQAGQTAVLLERDDGVFRYGEWLGGGGERSLCGVLLDKLYAGGQAQGDIQLWAATGDDCAGLPAGIERHGAAEPLSLYARQWPAAGALNLLVGDYAPQVRRRNPLKPWLPAAAILSIALLAQLAGQWQLQRRQQQQLQTLEAGTEALFRQTFPEIKRLVNVKAQADQQLLALQEQSRLNTAGFLALLHVVGGPLKEAPQLRLQRLQFDGDSLQIKLLAPDAASVEQFKRQLGGENGPQVDILAVAGVADGVEAEIAIRQN